MEGMKLWSKTGGIFLLSSLLVFFVLSILSHSLALDESTCVLGKTEMTHCPNETAGALHIVGDHLNLFLGVMQSESIEKFLLGSLSVALFLTGGLFIEYASDRLLLQSKHYFSRRKWRDSLLSSLKAFFSWSAFAYSYSR